MNKAFTKEADYDPTAELVIRPLPVLPSGVKNYITPAGAETLRAEARELESARLSLVEELSRRANEGQQEDKEHKILQAGLRQLDEQIRHLNERVGSVEVVAPRDDPNVTINHEDRVRFGDCLVAANPDGTEHVYTIVGVDEADAAAGRISWISPLGKAFLGAEIGDEVIVHRPRGDIVMEIISIGDQ